MNESKAPRYWGAREGFLKNGNFLENVGTCKENRF